MTNLEVTPAPTERRFGGQNYSLSDIQKMGEAVVASGLFGVKNAQQAVALMLISQAEGEHPIRAAQQYHIIQGRAAMKSEAMLARFQSAGGSIEWVHSTDTKAKAILTHPAGGSLPVEWDMERAKRAGLLGKDNWKTYPAAMLRARVISEGVRAVFPGCVLGIYTDDEVESFAVPVTQLPAGKGMAGLDAKVAVVVGDPSVYSEREDDAALVSVASMPPAVEDVPAKLFDDDGDDPLAKYIDTPTKLKLARSIAIKSLGKALDDLNSDERGLLCSMIQQAEVQK